MLLWGTCLDIPNLWISYYAWYSNNSCLQILHYFYSDSGKHQKSNTHNGTYWIWSSKASGSLHTIGWTRFQIRWKKRFKWTPGSHSRTVPRRSCHAWLKSVRVNTSVILIPPLLITRGGIEMCSITWGLSTITSRLSTIICSRMTSTVVWWWPSSVIRFLIIVRPRLWRQPKHCWSLWLVWVEAHLGLWWLVARRTHRIGARMAAWVTRAWPWHSWRTHYNKTIFKCSVRVLRYSTKLLWKQILVPTVTLNCSSSCRWNMACCHTVFDKYVHMLCDWCLLKRTAVP